jgi:hypothetical protein
MIAGGKHSFSAGSCMAIVLRCRDPRGADAWRGSEITRGKHSFSAGTCMRSCCVAETRAVQTRGADRTGETVVAVL